MTEKFKRIKEYLKNISEEDIDALTGNYEEGGKYLLNDEQNKLSAALSLYLCDVKTFTAKQFVKYVKEAEVLFILEKLRREGLITIDDNGIPKKTELGKRIECEEKKC